MARKKPAELSVSGDFEPDAYCIRSCGPNGESHNGFRWPLEVGAIVTCPDWSDEPECGHGLHGLLDGIGDWSLINDETGRLWQIVGVLRSEVVCIDGDKVKYPRCKLAYIGTAAGAIGWIQPHMVKGIQALANPTTGYGSAAATTGDRSAAATTGYGSTAATTGDRSAAATTGYGSTAATTGDRSAAATTGDRSAAATTGYGSTAATTGENSIAAALGKFGTAKAGEDGWIVLAAWDDDWNVVSVRAGQVGGPEGIKPNVFYRLSLEGEFEEAAA